MINYFICSSCDSLSELIDNKIHLISELANSEDNVCDWICMNCYYEFKDNIYLADHYEVW